MTNAPKRVQNDGIVIEDLAESISQKRTDLRPEKWKHPTDLDPLRRTLVAAMNKHGWPLDGIPGVLPFIYAKIEVGDIHAFSLFNDLPCTDVSLVQANPAQWYVTENAARYLLKAILGFVDGTHGLQENIDDSEILVPHQVKSILYNNSDEPIWDEWAEIPMLTARQAVPLMHGLNPKFFSTEGAALPPGRARKSSGAQELFRVCSHRITVAEASDLNKLTPAKWQAWATKLGWKVLPQFMDMVETPAESNIEPTQGQEAAKPLQRQRYQEQEILRVIEELGFTALALPKPPPGQNGPRAAVREKLSFSTGVFDKAWERLRNQGRIKDTK